MTATGGLIIRHAEPVMGTLVSFDLRPRGMSRRQTGQALARACSILHDADEVFSLYRPDSALSRLRRGELRIDECPAEIAEIIDRCHTARDLSGGWFDPWSAAEGFDPTGLVKGWAAGRAAAELRHAGIAAAMVNAAGDIVAFGRPGSDRAWQIGIRSPDAPDRLSCVVEATGAIATSGTYERGPHIWNPRTGAAATAACSATVCGPDLTVADALATGLIAAGHAGLGAVRDAGYEALIGMPSDRWACTPGFPFAGRRPALPLEAQSRQG